MGTLVAMSAVTRSEVLLIQEGRGSSIHASLRL